jgi:hypothetical protein
MTITFENDNDVIVYALEKIISYARNNQYIFLAQSVWWISSILGLQQGLIIHLDNLNARRNQNSINKATDSPGNSAVPDQEVLDTNPHIHPSRIAQSQPSDGDYSTSDEDSISTTESAIHHEVIENCEIFLKQSEQERKAIGRKNRQASRVVKRKANKKKPLKTFGTQTEGIDGSELCRRKAAGECQRCAWPRDRKGSHKTLDCFCWKRVEKGTAPFPKKKRYNKD